MIKLNFFIAILFALATPCTIQAGYITLPKNAEGWTQFTPSTDTVIVYIAPDGDDGTCTGYLASDEEIGPDPFDPVGAIIPCATLAGAKIHTTAGDPDWILYERGGEYPGGIYPRSGRSETEPAVIGAYGSSGDTPLILAGSGEGVVASLTSTSNPNSTGYFVLSGLDFYADTRDPDSATFVDYDGSTGLKLNTYGEGNSITSVLIEGCKFRFFVMNAVTAANGGTISFVSLRRNTIENSYRETTAAHSQGIFADHVDGFFLEENFMRHNGWMHTSAEGGVGVATVYNHNTYFAGVKNCTLLNNTFMDGSNMNNKFTSPYGDSVNITIQGNLYVGGDIGIGIGTNYLAIPGRFQNITIKNNVMTNLGRINANGQGIAWGIDVSGWTDGSVTGNLLMNQLGELTPSGTHGVVVWSDALGVVVSYNIFYNFEDTASDVFMGGSATSQYSLTNNIISMPSGARKMMTSSVEATTSGSNTFYSADGSNDGFYVDGSEYSFTAAMALLGDTTSKFEQPVFSDSSRTIETYMESISETNTIEAFIEACRGQDRYNWDERYTADAVNTYLRAGFFTSHTPRRVLRGFRWPLTQ